MLRLNLTSSRARYRVRLPTLNRGGLARHAWLAVPLGLAASCGETTGATDDRIGAIEVSPPSLALSAGAARALNATVLDESGSPVGSAQVHWSAEDPNIATVSQQGVVTAVAPGKTQVAASRSGKSAVVPVTVSTLPPALVRLSPSSSSLVIGATTRLTAEMLDAGGGILTGYPFAWSSANPSIASVDTNGVVTGAAVGNVVITATAADLSGTAVVTVSRAPVSTVTVTPATGTLKIGKTLQLSATLRDAAGQVLTGRTVTWSSAELNIASVLTGGLVFARRKGVVTIRATSEGKVGTARITVR